MSPYVSLENLFITTSHMTNNFSSGWLFKGSEKTLNCFSVTSAFVDTSRALGMCLVVARTISGARYISHWSALDLV